MKEPKVGQWYVDNIDAQFQVIDVDEINGIVELQYADGDIEELDIEDWHDEEFEEIAPPIIEELDNDDPGEGHHFDDERWGTA